MTGIYKITNPKNKIYIGQSRDIDRRFNVYRRLECKNQIKLFNSLNKYGFESHIFEILEECLFEELNIRERYYQDYYDVTSKKGLNCTLQETNVLPRIVSEETKLKLKNRIISQETRDKISKTSMGHKGYFNNKKHTEEAKLKISLGNTGNIHTKESREKMSKYHKGKILSEKTKEKIRIGNQGKGMSIENRIIVSKRQSKPILQYDLEDNFIKEWRNVTEAKNYFKGDIPAALKGRQHQSCGFKWKYKNE